jgi:hypothetical protein
VTAVDVSIAIAAGSAFASAVSAYQSARSVALDHRPIVVGDECRELTELYLDSDTPDVGAVGVTLRNEGPGTALNVRYRVRSWTWENIDTDWSHSMGRSRHRKNGATPQYSVYLRDSRPLNSGSSTSKSFKVRGSPNTCFGSSRPSLTNVRRTRHPALDNRAYVDHRANLGDLQSQPDLAGGPARVKPLSCD